MVHAKERPPAVPTWDIIDSFFTQSGSADCANTLVRHQIESYNEFLDKKLIQIIQGFNPITVCHNFDPEVGDFRYKIYLNVIQPCITKPMYIASDGTQTVMTPHMARMNNLTYAANIYVDIHVITEALNSDGFVERKEEQLPNVCIGKIPIMVRSKACTLTQIPDIAHKKDNDECRFDMGGYFIINGNEKVVISQDRISENQTLVFQPNGNADGLYAEIRSMPDGVFLPPKTTSLHLSGKPNHMGRVIRMNASFLRSDIPVFVMFRALGVESDKDILAYILLDINDQKNERLVQELAACADDASDIHTQTDALQVLMKILGTTGTPREYLDQPGRAFEILKSTIRNDFLAHVGPSFERKALYLGYMIRKLLRIHLGYEPYDNRDSYLHKRIDTPGILFSTLFRQCYGKLIKDVRNQVVRELNLWRAQQNAPLNIITPANVHCFFRTSVIEAGLRYALSTGNWGVKSIGSFQNIRQGVAQVLNRLSYLSTLSHLRRINTPMEKNGKLVQPRKLENTQFGMICPSETPEGASVGLVKNMAMSTHITTSISSAYVRELIEKLGTMIMDERVQDARSFLVRMGQADAVHVMINGDIVGFHINPLEFYSRMKHYKRCGVIAPTTSLVWDVPHNMIRISTEAGRMCRPLHIVSSHPKLGTTVKIQKLLLEGCLDWKQFADRKYFQHFIAPMTDAEEEGFLEYMDVDEIDKAMVAMGFDDLQRGPIGTSLAPCFTHCEIHPSLINGVLAANIPFMDHNQSPRNCYQCLWQEEHVRMVDGSLKAIKNIRIGDEIVCFDPKTMVPHNTRVINQYVRPAQKPIYCVGTISGRRIIVTQDHKFMTSSGWLDPYSFTNDTKVGISYYPCNLPDAPGNGTIPLESLPSNTKDLLSELGLYPLTHDNPKLPILARIVGYISASSTIGFRTFADEHRFEDDARVLGFGHGSRDATLLRLATVMKDDAFDWLPGASKLVIREFVAGYQGGYDGIVWEMEGMKELVSSVQVVKTEREYMEWFGIHYNQTKSMVWAKRCEYERYVDVCRKSGDQQQTPMPLEQWDALVTVEAGTMFVPVVEKKKVRNVLISDITVESDHHSFFGGDGFAVSNSAMGKQAVGIYMSNFNQRIDTMAHVLHYPQKHIVRTKLSKYTHSDDIPSGINAIVAVMTHTGYNQEDSVMINRSAIDRGLFTSTYYKSYRDQCNKNHSTGEEEIFKKVESTNPSGAIKPFNYDKLADDGFVPKNTYVGNNDIIVGKVMPYKVHGVVHERDTSMQIKGNDEGYIDMNYIGTNADAYKFCKIRLRKYRKPVVGDKLASTAAQKGTIGMIYQQHDMPFTKDGIVPDIIMNPHAIPSRMTMGQLMECIMGKAACHIGAYGDATPFSDCSVEGIAKILERSGYERYGNEILYNGRTGEQIKTEIFIGPTYYQRLKHMVSDKSHCLTPDHDVLTEAGWKNITEVTIEDKVATLKGDNLVYDHPTAVLGFPDYKGQMYHIKNQAIDLNVTMNHRMYVSTYNQMHARKRAWSDYQLKTAQEIVGKMARYKNDAVWDAPDYQFILQETGEVDMDAWLTLFGVWMVAGSTTDTKHVQICQCKPRVRQAVLEAITELGFTFDARDDKITITNHQLYNYIKPLSVGAPFKSFPDWVWSLSAMQCRKLIYAMQLGDDTFQKNGCCVYYTSSDVLADQMMRLCLHAGWTGMKYIEHKAGDVAQMEDGRISTAKHNLWRVSVNTMRSNPSVNHLHATEQECQVEEVYDYEGPVYCLQVPSEVFMVRRNGKAVWTGNSRGSNGPIIMLTRQPAEGRARNGGLRFGEMERDAIVAHGASAFLKERMLDVSDNFRVFVCRKCGLLCTGNPDKNLFRCNNCKNSADITQVRIPYSMKLLMQELMTMGVAPRLMV